jgi:hypothetical protein
MHSTKKSKKKSKKTERSEPTASETTTRRYNRDFLNRIFHKNKATVASHGVSQAAATTTVQSSTTIQPTNTNTKSQQGPSGTQQSTTPASIIPPTPQQTTPTTTMKNPPSSAQNVANVTPAKVPMDTSQTAAKQAPVPQAKSKPANYYSKLAASKYNCPDLDNSSSSSDSNSSSSSSDDSSEITRAEESSSSNEDNPNDDAYYDEGDVQMAIRHSLGLAAPVPAKKIAYRKTAEDMKPAAKKVTDTKKSPPKSKVFVDTLYGNKTLSGQVSIQQDKATGKINLSQEFDKEAAQPIQSKTR